jgi:hypothetical protein
MGWLVCDLIGAIVAEIAEKREGNRGKLTFRSGLAISGRMLQNGLITSRNFTGKESVVSWETEKSIGAVGRKHTHEGW